jgi:DNA-binding NarL/FixJ family response regulator
VRVVIAEDSLLFREGLARLLGENGFEVAATAADASRLLAEVARHQPDVAIVDIRMPPSQTTEGLDAARRIRASNRKVGVLVLSQHVETHHALELLSDPPGGVGYLLKDRVSDLHEFCGAVRRVGEGGSAVDPELVSRLLARRRERDPLAELTEREREVLALMAEGQSNHGIAKRLFLSPKTVEAHIHRIFTKLSLFPGDIGHRRVLAVLTFLHEGHQD